MKRLSLLISLLTLLSTPELLRAQCTVARPAVEILEITPAGPNSCTIKFNFSFDLQFNNGNKQIFIHVWPTAQYPAFPYANNNKPGDAALANTIANFSIDNFGTEPFLRDNLSCAPNTPTIGPNDGASIVKGPSEFAGFERFTVLNGVVTIPFVCGQLVSLTGDLWSSQSSGSCPPAQCFITGSRFNFNQVDVQGRVVCTDPRVYDLNITTQTIDPFPVSWRTFIDNGDGIFNPVTDFLAATGGPTAVSASSPINLEDLPYNQDQTNKNRNLWIEVTGPDLPNAVIAFVQNDCEILPVRLREFTGINQGKTNLLRWTTVSEVNAKEFQLESSQDGVTFRQIAKLASKAANGNSNQRLTYEAPDNNPYTVTFYRLRMVDRDGSFEFSRTISVRAGKTTNAPVIQPNPSRGTFTISGVAASEVRKGLSIYSAAGQRIGYNITAINEAAGTATVEMRPAARGIYFVEINGPAGRQVQRLIVE